MPGEDHNQLHRGSAPLLVSVPHAGLMLPSALAERMTANGRSLPDTDWYVDRLYAFAKDLGASMLTAGHSRYVVDLNRPPDDAPLYAAATTGLIPTLTFAGDAIYRDGLEPDAAERSGRVARYWAPYHEKLATELNAIRERHGHVVLLDAHSIAGEVPRLFEGELPALNLGSDNGVSADPGLIDAVFDLLAETDYSSVRDGRFRGGYITRHYGRPTSGMHALQLEISQRSYMCERPAEWDGARAERLQSILEDLVSLLIRWRPDAQ
jgi:N-formylglutamate amidohydrolase